MDNPLTLTARVILFGAVMAFPAFRFRALRNEFAAYA